jgi:peptidoglycan/xylan/chitin deacetylase (PgdA/CDA1 family)
MAGFCFSLALAGCGKVVDLNDKPGDAQGASWALSPRSGLPLPGSGGVAAPTGTGASLKVLDWAGYAGAVSYTFDDTQPSQIEHWPAIKATGVRATWYMAQTYGSGSSFENTWKDVLASGHEIGNHTVNHKYVNELAALYPSSTTAAAAAKELDDCDAYIKNTIGQSGVWTMAYPYGDTAWKSYLGSRYLFARTVNDGRVTPGANLDALLLPSYMVGSSDTEASFDAKIDAAATAKAWQVFLFHSLTPTASNWYAGVPAADVAASLEHGKASGGVWLDSVVNVGSYWLAAKLLRAASPKASASGSSWTWTLPPGFPSGKYLRVTVDGGKLSQGGADLEWNEHGFYEAALDSGSLDWRP